MTRQDLSVSVTEIGINTVIKENSDFSLKSIPILNCNGSVDSVCYTCTIPAFPGKFDVSKAMLLKVPKGPLFAKLKNGFPVTLEDGTIIRPEQVLGPKDVSKAVIIVCKIPPFEGDTPDNNSNLLDSLVNNVLWEM